jgi:hypothetical protein
MISAANEAGDRNNPTNAVQIRLRASLIGQKDCVILPQLSARLGLRQGHGRVFKAELWPLSMQSKDAIDGVQFGRLNELRMCDGDGKQRAFE